MVDQPITLSLPTRVEVELGCDNCEACGMIIIQVWQPTIHQQRVPFVLARRLGTENLARDTFVCVTGDKIRDDGNDATEVITHTEEDTSKYFHRKKTF